MVRYRLERGPIPLHHQVYLDLRSALDAGEWQAGERVPTERELATRYGCSLITIRRALADLAHEGRLERHRGRGTFVNEAPIVRDIAARAGFGEEMRARGLEPYAVVLAARQEPASPVVADALGLPVGAPVHYLERIRGADQVPLLLEQAYLSATRFAGLLDEDYSRESLYEVLEQRFDCPIVATRETISAVVPGRREAQLLGLKASRPALQLEGCAYAARDDAVEYSRTIVSSERARYYIETAGRRARLVEPVSLGPAAVSAAAGRRR